MKAFLLLLFTLTFIFSNAQKMPELSGLWQGIMIQKGKGIDQSKIFWIKFNSKNNSETREEIPNTEKFCVKSVLISNTTDSSFIFSESKINQKAKISNGWWCLHSAKLVFDSISGFMRGTYTSKNCRNAKGDILLFKSLNEHEFSYSETPVFQHGWYKKFIETRNENKNSPWRMEYDLANFEFTPVYFDFDSSTIKPEYHIFLKKMAELVEYKHDLRIKVTGHTDNIGEDSYNVILSKKRAKAILNFFKKEGIENHKILIDFKGEKKPAVPNSNKDNRQLNRRVDFSFI
jgi:OmpA-OmpF porin, OOP family